MATAGPGRQTVRSSTCDPCCHAGRRLETYAPPVREAVRHLGEGGFRAFVDESERAHAISRRAMDLVLARLRRRAETRRRSPSRAEMIQIIDEARAAARLPRPTGWGRVWNMGMIDKRIIPGTPVFDGEAASRGYALNMMCYSFNDAANRAAFLADEEGYCRKFGLDEAQRRSVADRDVAAMIAAGGNVYYLAKLAGIFGLGVQDIGAQQTGLSVEAFRARLAAQA